MTEDLVEFLQQVVLRLGLERFRHDLVDYAPEFANGERDDHGFVRDCGFHG